MTITQTILNTKFKFSKMTTTTYRCIFTVYEKINDQDFHSGIEELVSKDKRSHP